MMRINETNEPILKGLYIKGEVYSEQKNKILIRLRELMDFDILSVNEVINLACMLFDMTDKGLVSEFEIFKEVRDRIEGDRVII